MGRFTVTCAAVLAVLIAFGISPPSRAGNTAVNINSTGSTKQGESDRFGISENHLTIQLGKFGPTFNSDIRVDSDSSQGGDIDLEETAGLESNQSIFRMDAMWRVGRKQRIGLTYFSDDRSVLWTLQDDEVVGGITFPAGTGVNLDFDTDYLLLKYLYSFKQSDTVEMAASLGVHTLDFDFSMLSTESDLSAAADGTAPLPMLGFYVDYRPSPLWRLFGNVEALDISIGDYSGTFTDMGTGIEYTIAKNYGVGIGYDHFNTSVDASASSFSGHLEYDFRGMQLFVVGRF